jgi:hypothetical protein|tara:strand:- start:2179 stop:2331 length:153 start_codon:yes stop_codon:yes gene_type:complete
MSESLNTENKNLEKSNNEVHNQFLESGLYIKEDDQDWGSSGMNDIQKKSD